MLTYKFKQSRKTIRLYTGQNHQTNRATRKDINWSNRRDFKMFLNKTSSFVMLWGYKMGYKTCFTVTKLSLWGNTRYGESRK